jgi:holin-like protein
MIRGVGLLLGFQLVGELTVWACRLPISGPICGMAALLAWLCCHGRISDDLGKVVDGLLANMAILFVPVGAGAVVYADLFRSHWPAIVVAIFLGTSVTIAVTSMTAQFLSRLPAADFGELRSRQQWQMLARSLRASGRRATRSSVFAVRRIAARFAQLSSEWTSRFSTFPRRMRTLAKSLCARCRRTARSGALLRNWLP